MRVLLLALMIALLPIRGWMGNAMAVSMAAQQVSMAASDAASAAMPEDCPMQMQATAGADTAAPDASPAQGGTAHCSCDTCELCLALASVSPFQMPHMSFAPAVGPVADGLLFVSADRATGLKPPIS